MLGIIGILLWGFFSLFLLLAVIAMKLCC
jgi:hypothetical protein